MSDEQNTVTPKLYVSELVDLAYDIAKESYGGQFFSFTNIWSKTWKAATKFSKEKVDTWIGYFYTEILTDPRFVVISFNKWKLKEYMNFNDVKKLEKTVFSDDSIFEEEYEAYVAAEHAKKEVEIVPETSSEEVPEDLEEKEDESEAGESDDLFEEEL